MIAEFQSTPPVWGATVSMNTGRGNLDAFQSTPPVWGATLTSRATGTTSSIFQSTPPVWGATCPADCFLVLLKISIHAPRVGGDVSQTHRQPKPF